MRQDIPWANSWSAISIFLLFVNKGYIDLFCKASHAKHKPTRDYDVEISQHKTAINEIRAYLAQAVYSPLSKADLIFGCKAFPIRLLTKCSL